MPAGISSGKGLTVRDVPPALRLPMLVLGMIALVMGVLAGLARLALEVPALAQARAAGHGALMIAAFFGTVISLERAVALGRAWPYLALFSWPVRPVGSPSRFSSWPVPC
jgi:hypothetical protein